MIQKARRNAIHRRSSGRENVRDVISYFLSIAQGNVCINHGPKKIWMESKALIWARGL